MEVWKDIIGFEGFYQISNTGKVKSLSRVWMGKTKNGKEKKCVTKERLLKSYTYQGKRSNIKPYSGVLLRKDGVNKHTSIHRLVALHFVPNTDPDNLIEVNHIDGDRLNNEYSNLEWVTKHQNILHAFENKLIKTEKTVVKIDKLTNEIICKYRSESEACRIHGVKQGKIGRAIKRNGTSCGFKWQYE